MKKRAKKQVAVIVPLSTRPELTPDEEISLHHLRHFLGKYDKFMIAPDSLNVQHDDFAMIHFGDQYFGSVLNHCKLLVSPHFYKTFRNYQYIFIHHLDSLVLSDQLSNWCARGFDYLAPPWIKYAGSSYEGRPFENKIGNGGFSLRNIASFLRVLRILRRPKPTLDYLRRITGRRKRIEDKHGEDIFWGTQAVNIDPSFQVAPLETALQFGFECNPRLCLEMNRDHLPFGGHAWPRYDRAFWEPHLLPANA